MTNNPRFLVFNDDGDEVEIPSHFVVCDRCNGKGVHDHAAFSNGISQDQFDEDEDFRESYFRGHYDVPCSDCDGQRVVAAPDEDRLTQEQQRWLESHYQARSEAAAERRMRERGIEF